VVADVRKIAVRKSAASLQVAVISLR